jgi:hypothetical protein
MGWSQLVDYEDVKVTLPPPVCKKFWDGDKFVELKLYRLTNITDVNNTLEWLQGTYGAAGTYHAGHFWDYAWRGNYLLMDEEVYTWYQLRWSKK